MQNQTSKLPAINKITGLVKICPTIGEFCLKRNPMECFKKYRHIKTALQAFESDAYKLSEIKSAYDQDSVELYIEIWVENLNSALNLTRKLNAEQLKEIACFIYDEFCFLNIAELLLVFNKIKKGEYGDFYGGIDVSKIITSFRTYCQQRNTEIRQKEFNKGGYSMVEKVNMLHKLLVSNSDKCPSYMKLVDSVKVTPLNKN